MPQWNYYIFFFNGKIPFRRIVSKEVEAPPPILPSETFVETKDRPGKYNLLSRNLTSHKAYYVFMYEKTHKNPASKATSDDFPPLKYMHEAVMPQTVILEEDVLGILKYRGKFALVINISVEEGSATEQSVAKPQNSQAVTETRFSFDDYEQHSELFKTRLFATAVRKKLGPSFIVRDQVEVYYYCEFNARVDLAISKKSTVSISAEDIMEIEQAPPSPIPKTFTDETKNPETTHHKIYQTLAGMLCIASEDAISNYIAQEIDVDIIESYGLSILGDKVHVLKIELSMHKGTIHISKSEEVSLHTGFNYVLEKIQ